MYNNRVTVQDTEMRTLLATLVISGVLTAASQLARDLGATPTSQSQLRRFASESWRPADPGAWAKGVWQAYCALTDDLSLLLGERPRHPGPLTGGRAQERAATRTP